MNKSERLSTIETVTGCKVEYQETIKNVVYYVGEDGSLLAKYWPLTGKLEIVKGECK